MTRNRHPSFTFGTNVTRAAIRASRNEVRPAHPWIADALCAAGAWFAAPYRLCWVLVFVASTLVLALALAGVLPE